MLLKISALWLNGEIEIAPGACKVFVQLPDGLGYCCRYFSFGGRLTGCGFVFGARKQHGLEMGISAAFVAGDELREATARDIEAWKAVAKQAGISNE